MKISYNWLKEYIDIDLEINELSRILTDIGLEVGSIESYESVKGGLKGLLVGEVLTCVKHENADKLSVTTVKVAEDQILPIVCGAPNVAAGQKVIVATVGTVLYSGDESFTIKKSKIRGEKSEGMICAEDEIGMGSSHDGILVLPQDTPVGMPAADYFKVENDTIFEIDLTPNRADGASHIGVARDLAAYFQSRGENIQVKSPFGQDFKAEKTGDKVEVQLKNTDACHRYSGVLIKNIKVEASPEWLQNKLKSIGINPTNNIVDITNFVLHETGQPLHAFDMAEINDNTIVVDSAKKGEKLTTLDEVERELHENDLLISDNQKPLCIAGVLGGLTSGVSDSTKDIFLESAYFDSVWVRKTAKRHTISTDASYRFERGTDPNICVDALKRAALLIQEIAGGQIDENIIDIYPEPVQNFVFEVNINRMLTLIGQDIPKETIVGILNALEIKVEDLGDNLKLSVPPYRVDVQREADIVEDILRIYGYNNIAMSNSIKSAISYAKKPNKHSIVNYVSDFLASNGFNEMMANSLTKSAYYEGLETMSVAQSVKLNNPLSSDLNVMRQTLLFGALESVAYNHNHKLANIRLFEFGNCSYYLPKEENENPQKNYQETFKLALTISGKKKEASWSQSASESDFYMMKRYVEHILKKLRINDFKEESFSNDIWEEGLIYTYKNKTMVRFGILKADILSQFEIEKDVYFAEFEFENVLKSLPKQDIQFKEISKFPEVRRDLALLLDEEVLFSDLKQLALKTEKKLLKKVDIFDVYKGDKLEKGKKSYALSFIFQDQDKTLNDKQIDKIMKKLIFNFENTFSAQLR